jgi:cytochrome P450
VRIPGGERMVVTTDPVIVEHMLSRKEKFTNYVKGKEWHSRFEEILGDGIFSVDGHSWAKQRKTASHLFSVRSFRDEMSIVFRTHGREVLKKLAAAADSGAIIDAQDLFFRYTFDSIGTSRLLATQFHAGTWRLVLTRGSSFRLQAKSPSV